MLVHHVDGHVIAMQTAVIFAVERPVAADRTGMTHVGRADHNTVHFHIDIDNVRN